MKVEEIRVEVKEREPGDTLREGREKMSGEL